MSNERELLEAAGRAAGQGRSVGGDLWSFARGYLWEPHKDDGDSFRLAAALRISVEHNHPQDNEPWVSASVERIGAEGMCMGVECFMEDVPDESQRADRIRLAILRCAAAQAPAVAMETAENGAKTAGNGVDAGCRRGGGA